MAASLLKCTPCVCLGMCVCAGLNTFVVYLACSLCCAISVLSRRMGMRIRPMPGNGHTSRHTGIHTLGHKIRVCEGGGRRRETKF